MSYTNGICTQIYISSVEVPPGWYGFPTQEAGKQCPRFFAISFQVTAAKRTPFNSKIMKLVSKKMFGCDILLMVKQWPCKDSKLDDEMTSRRISWRKK